MIRKLKMPVIILLTISMSILAGCAGSGSLMESLVCSMPPAPTRPEIQVSQTEDGLIAITPEDLGKLNVYILELERGYITEL